MRSRPSRAPGVLSSSHFSALGSAMKERHAGLEVDILFLHFCESVLEAMKPHTSQRKSAAHRKGGDWGEGRQGERAQVFSRHCGRQLWTAPFASLTTPSCPCCVPVVSLPSVPGNCFTPERQEEAHEGRRRALLWLPSTRTAGACPGCLSQAEFSQGSRPWVGHAGSQPPPVTASFLNIMKFSVSCSVFGVIPRSLLPKAILLGAMHWPGLRCSPLQMLLASYRIVST